MPLNSKKIINIILEECESIKERCYGYREELVEVIAEIIDYERQHRYQAMNIQQKINDKINTTGRFLAEHRKKSSTN